MAIANLKLINALRATAVRLSNGATYAWGHHGSCNCGNLVQVISNMTEGEIIRYAHSQPSSGEWTELAEEYCPVTNAPFALVMSKLEEIGLSSADMHHIEYLNDKAVLGSLPNGFKWLQKNVRKDVIEYFNAFANMLENQLLENINLNLEEILKEDIDYEQELLFI